MLDTPTKHRIDACRDILVGKVPDPKSQVEQITLALIYKFMDDMDAESEEFGGRRTFFADEFARYGWARLMSPATGGQEMLNLYAEGIARMNENPGIPPLFRDIFKNAFLPYRDPETLRAFLKEINAFTYDHSERLGDAFEYLLLVLGSQGDAGQFRTPRQIIDFIVAVVDPQKNEKVLDPACGTAGFLISAYNHILKANQDAGLTSDERNNLVKNFTGYDISPDMVRLSLVNLYLHHFPTPQIFEYDTLTSDDKWTEYADVILANPPFMSPKGGIRPHTRFGVQSSRSEVLFVDYIAEHLLARGRAGVIVPEGVIFQSGTAYKKLREKLVKDFLVAVISLPAGVSQPYAGVKTSVLILDRALARASDKVLFVKIASDGFGLGAQRRAIPQNDLPDALHLLRAWRDHLRHMSPFVISGSVNAQAVTKEKIAASGDYNLSGDRYGDSATHSNVYPMVEIGDVVEILDSKRRPITKHERIPGPYPYYGATGVLDYVHDYLFDEQLVLVGEDGAKWNIGDKTAFCIRGKTWVNNHAHVLRPLRDRLLDIYLIELLNNMDLSPYITGVTVPKLNQEKLRGIRIPLPPLSVQQEIVAEIEGYQKIIDGARQVVENYKPRIDVRPEWPVVALGEVLTFVGSGVTPLGGQEAYVPSGVLFVRSQNVLWGQCDFSDAAHITEQTHREMAHSELRCGDVLLNITGASIGRCALYALDQAANVNQHVAILRPNAELLSLFLMQCLLSKGLQDQIWAVQSGASRQALNYQQIKSLQIPLPDLTTQRAIVAEIEAEQRLVDANRELVTRFEAKIKAVIARVWGEDPADADNTAKEAPPPQ